MPVVGQVAGADPHRDVHRAAERHQQPGLTGAEPDPHRPGGDERAERVGRGAGQHDRQHGHQQGGPRRPVQAELRAPDGGPRRGGLAETGDHGDRPAQRGGREGPAPADHGGHHRHREAGDHDRERDRRLLDAEAQPAAVRRHDLRHRQVRGDLAGRVADAEQHHQRHQRGPRRHQRHSGAAGGGEGAGQDGGGTPTQPVHRAPAEERGQRGCAEERRDRDAEPARAESQLVADQHRLRPEQEDRQRPERGHRAGAEHGPQQRGDAGHRDRICRGTGTAAFSQIRVDVDDRTILGGHTDRGGSMSLDAPHQVADQDRGSARDRAATATVLAFAAMLWCSWGLTEPPPSWVRPLDVAVYLAVATTVVAAALAWRRRHGRSAMADAEVRARYLRVVGIEGLAIGVGVVLLIVLGLPEQIPSWTLLVVGVHFVPLGRAFRVPELTPCGVVCAVLAVAAAVLGVADVVAPNAVAGGLGGIAMLATALVCLARR